MKFSKISWKMDLDLILTFVLALIIIIYSIGGKNKLHTLIASLILLIVFFIVIKKRRRKV